MKRISYFIRILFLQACKALCTSYIQKVDHHRCLGAPNLQGLSVSPTYLVPVPYHGTVTGARRAVAGGAPFSGQKARRSREEREGGPSP